MPKHRPPSRRPTTTSRSSGRSGSASRSSTSTSTRPTSCRAASSPRSPSGRWSCTGRSATVGFTDLSHLARSLEHALARTQVIGHGTDDEARLFVNAAEEIRRLLHQFAAGFLQQPAPELLVRLAEHEVSSAKRLEAATAASELAEAQDSVMPAEPLAVESLLSLDGIDDGADAANDAH